MEPRTAGGREALRWMASKGYPTDPMRGFILIAERDARAEAEAAALERVRAGVERIREHSQRMGAWGIEYGDDQFCKAVLRLLEGRVMETVPRSPREAGARADDLVWDDASNNLVPPESKAGDRAEKGAP